jgi:energy-coupling factor transporter ATP-binding protein EcfA2
LDVASAGASAGGPVGIEARNWGWRHGTRKAWAVRGLDLSIEPGERVLLLGPSGAGKSTLLAGLAGLLDPAESGGDEEGELLLDGVPVRRARVQAVRRGRALTGLLLQDPQAQTVLARCGDDVAFGLENHAVPTDEIWPRVDRAMREVGFPYPREHPTSALSGGQRQRLAFAGVLALDPGLFLLDEPTAMLDPSGADLIRDSIAAVLASRRAGCLLVEHRVAPWLPLIDRVVVLAPGGGVQAEGTPEQVFTEHGVALAAAGIWVPGIRPMASVAPRRTTSKPASTAALLTAEGLAARRPGGKPVVSDLNFTANAGQALCVVGENGVGKSTLALTVAGLVRPAEGELTAAASLDAGAGPHPYAWRAGQLVSRIGTVFQEPQHQFVAATVAAELAVGPSKAAGRRGRDEPQSAVAGPQADELLERLRLTHLARANPFTLSGGEQRRLSVATVLATAPSVLVLDEPTFGQDARTWAELTALLIELLDQGAAIVVATHDQELVAELTDADRAQVLAL